MRPSYFSELCLKSLSCVFSLYLRCPTAAGAPSPAPSWGLWERSPPRWWLGSWGWSCGAHTAWWCWSYPPRGLLWPGSCRGAPCGGCSAWRPRRRARAAHESTVEEERRTRGMKAEGGREDWRSGEWEAEERREEAATALSHAGKVELRGVGPPCDRSASREGPCCATAACEGDPGRWELTDPQRRRV